MRAGRFGWALLAGFAALAGCATAYRPSPLGLGDGYRERLLGPGLWQVTGSANGFSRPGLGTDIALYRAAELAGAAGFAYFQILDGDYDAGSITSTAFGGGTTYVGDRQTLKIRGVRDAEAPLACEARDPRRCRTLSVAEVRAQIGPRLSAASR
jgi:hypothetical protein